MPERPRLISRTVWILSMVSLFADFASEMLYPVVPVYLKEIGFSVALIGLLEGFAEFIVGLSKGYFGKQSDQTGLRLPFVKLGYLLSALSKPMMALFPTPLGIFGARSTDRLGKGIRTGARDAILTSASTPATRARIFNFHRGWDTVGAILGPLFALAFLEWFPGQYKPLFFWAVVPGLAAVGLIYLLRETSAAPAKNGRPGFFGYFYFWQEGGPAFRKLLSGLLMFALANSSDAFLLLRAKAITGSDTLTIAAYVFYNIVYAASAYPMGILADRWGVKKTLLLGIAIFALVYLGFALNSQPTLIFPLFGIYGLYAAATEGISKAWISNLIQPQQAATAFGLYSSCQSICAMAASSIAGLIWAGASPYLTFMVSVGLALLAFIRLSLIPANTTPTSQN